MDSSQNVVGVDGIDNKLTEDDDSPRLSEHTLAALAEFYAEKSAEGKENSIQEDWQLSQFWYSTDTAETLALECVTAVQNGGKIACVSCPTLMGSLFQNESIRSKQISLKLLEFDSRFAAKYPSEFVSYDYRNPLDLPKDCRNCFDLIIVDPPFLSDDCFVKVAQTVRLLSKDPSSRLIICTGAVMEPMVQRLFNARRCAFNPTHQRNLANEFACFTNYHPNHL